MASLVIENLATEQIEMAEGRVVRYAEYPITFDMFLELCGPKDYSELINGVLVEKPMVQLEHEKLFGWLFWLLYGYVKKRSLGVVLSSRTAVEISRFRGRLPDIMFVRSEHLHLVQQKAVYGAPDLIIELVSPNDRPSDLIALETDYRSIEVSEILFIDQQKRRIRLLQKRGADYAESNLTTGAWSSETVEGFMVEVDWLFQDPRPDEYETLMRLLESPV